MLLLKEWLLTENDFISWRFNLQMKLKRIIEFKSPHFDKADSTRSQAVGEGHQQPYGKMQKFENLKRWTPEGNQMNKKISEKGKEPDS